MGFLKIQFVAKYQKKMKERPFGDIEKFRKIFEIFKKKQKMRTFNSLIAPKNVKEGPLGFFNIHSAAKPKKIEGGPLKTLKNEKKSHKAEKGTLLGFAFQGRGLWMRSKSSTEYFW